MVAVCHKFQINVTAVAKLHDMPAGIRVGLNRIITADLKAVTVGRLIIYIMGLSVGYIHTQLQAGICGGTALTIRVFAISKIRNLAVFSRQSGNILIHKHKIRRPGRFLHKIIEHIFRPRNIVVPVGIGFIDHKAKRQRIRIFIKVLTAGSI